MIENQIPSTSFQM